MTAPGLLPERLAGPRLLPARTDDPRLRARCRPASGSPVHGVPAPGSVLPDPARGQLAACPELRDPGNWRAWPRPQRRGRRRVAWLPGERTLRGALHRWARAPLRAAAAQDSSAGPAAVLACRHRDRATKGVLAGDAPAGAAGLRLIPGLAGLPCQASPRLARHLASACATTRADLPGPGTLASCQSLRLGNLPIVAVASRAAASMNMSHASRTTAMPAEQRPCQQSYGYASRAGATWPRASPSPMRVSPGPRALAAMTTSSPSCSHARLVPSGSEIGSRPFHASSISEPR